MSHDDFDFEPVRGLPQKLPASEQILWQGAPQWTALARHVFHVRFIAGYFALITFWRLATVGHDGSLTERAMVVLWPLALAAIVIGLVSFVAWGYARTTVYTITNRRVVLRSGIAFQVTFNIPFNAIVGAGLRTHRDGSADLPLELDGSAHIAYLHIWPHARPWHYSAVQPMLRNVPDAGRVSQVLEQALIEFKRSATVAQVLMDGGGTRQGIERRHRRSPGNAAPAPAVVAAE